MEEFKQYRRTNVAEMRPVTKTEVEIGRLLTTQKYGISISQADLNNGSPKLGDMIARNPEDHMDEWLVSEKYFKENFELK